MKNLYYEKNEAFKEAITVQKRNEYIEQFFLTIPIKTRNLYIQMKKHNLLPRLFIINNIVYEWGNARELIYKNNDAYCLYCGFKITPIYMKLDSNFLPTKLIHSTYNSECITVAEKTVMIKTNANNIEEMFNSDGDSKFSTVNKKALEKLQNIVKKQQEALNKQKKFNKNAVKIILNAIRGKTK